MPITRVKICGITRAQDAALAAELGADAIGLNFVGGPRLLNSNQAIAILDGLPPLLTPVCLILLDDKTMPHFDDAVNAAEKKLHFKFWHRTRQIYGLTEALLAAMREGFGPPDPESTRWPDTWLPIAIKTRESLAQLSSRLLRLGIHPGAILLDTASEKLGGTGQSFNWNWIAQAREAGELDGLPPLILAGGLTPDNVADAIRIAKPYAVDVSSGVEVPGKPGIKDPIKMRDFIQAAKQSGH